MVVADYDVKLFFLKIRVEVNKNGAVGDA